MTTIKTDATQTLKAVGARHLTLMTFRIECVCRLATQLVNVWNSLLRFASRLTFTQRAESLRPCFIGHIFFFSSCSTFMLCRVKFLCSIHYPKKKTSTLIE